MTQATSSDTEPRWAAPGPSQTVGEAGGAGSVDDLRARFATFCHLEHPRLLGMLVLYCGDRELAHDLAQETFARLWSDRRRWDRIGSLRGYAAQTALNLAKNEFRANAVRRRYQRLLRRDDARVPDSVDLADAMAVRDAVAALPERKRCALVLRYFADLSVEETARVMNARPNTVKSLTRRAIADLRVALDDPDMEDER